MSNSDIWGDTQALVYFKRSQVSVKNLISDQKEKFNSHKTNSPILVTGP